MANIADILISFLCCFSAALNRMLLTIHGLDEAGTLHGVYLNGKHFLSCEQHGQGHCRVGPPETWYQARDKASTITAIEVPIYPETGLQTTDLPADPLIRRDNKGHSCGGNLPQYSNCTVIWVLSGLFLVPNPCPD